VRYQGTARNCHLIVGEGSHLLASGGQHGDRANRGVDQRVDFGGHSAA
jgi:hypothetical protein